MKHYPTKKHYSWCLWNKTIFVDGHLPYKKGETATLKEARDCINREMATYKYEAWQIVRLSQTTINCHG